MALISKQNVATLMFSPTYGRLHGISPYYPLRIKSLFSDSGLSPHFLTSDYVPIYFLPTLD